MKNIDNFSFGDIVIASMPFSDGTSEKIRPVLILAKDREDYLFLKITTQIQKSEPFDIVLSPDSENHLKSISLIKTKKISTYTKEILHQKVGTLSDEDKQKVKANLISFLSQL
ncbi:MAG: type II toxin-antitoxin system PemK/MazF family toxin [Candidatus Peribacteria bacterium]|jgi:mRNA-degrading endonuclease toxin of MazEF toxin-antitoxin module|nr:type II toxin-antitoxin system PemK/MazF family toxin [Candidatus Peribacteria bacterium]